MVHDFLQQKSPSVEKLLLPNFTTLSPRHSWMWKPSSFRSLEFYSLEKIDGSILKLPQKPLFFVFLQNKHIRKNTLYSWKIWKNTWSRQASLPISASRSKYFPTKDVTGQANVCWHFSIYFPLNTWFHSPEMWLRRSWNRLLSWSSPLGGIMLYFLCGMALTGWAFWGPRHFMSEFYAYVIVDFWLYFIRPNTADHSLAHSMVTTRSPTSKPYWIQNLEFL